MPAAIAIPLILGGVSAGASLVSAKMQSNAAKDAAKTQEDAAKNVQNYQQRNTDQALSYINQQQQRPPTPMAAPMVYGQNMPSSGVPNQAMRQQQPSLAQLGGMQQQGRQVSPQPVQMRGPDGSLEMVAPERVDFMTAKGAVLA